MLLRASMGCRVRGAALMGVNVISVSIAKWKGRQIRLELLQFTWSGNGGRLLIDGAVVDEKKGQLPLLEATIKTKEREPGGMCGRCRNANGDGAQFCAHCGADLSALVSHTVLGSFSSGMFGGIKSCRISVDGETVLEENL